MDTSNIREYLEAVRNVSSLRRKIAAGLDKSPLAPRARVRSQNFFSLEEFVLKHGIPFDAGHAPAATLGPLRECFRNAALLALEHGDWIYCEGYAYAQGLIPTLHAWCVNPEGQILETTWREPGTEYYGIPFKASYLRDRLLTYDCYGLLDQWELKFPILREPPRLWFHARFKQHEKNPSRLA